MVNPGQNRTWAPKNASQLTFLRLLYFMIRTRHRTEGVNLQRSMKFGLNLPHLIPMSSTRSKDWRVREAALKVAPWLKIVEGPQEPVKPVGPDMSRMLMS